MRERADVFDERHQPHARHACRDRRAPIRRNERRQERVDPIRRAVEQGVDRLEVERADLHQRADVGAGIHLRNAELVDGVLRGLESQPLGREQEQNVGPRNHREDLRDLLLVLLEPRVRHAHEQVTIVPRHHAVAQEREEHLLGNLEPLGADLPALEVHQHFVAGAEQVRDGLLVLLPGLDEGMPFEVAQGQPGPIRRVGGRCGQRPRQLRRSVRRRVGVLRAGEPRRLRPWRRRPLPPRGGERACVEPVERGIAGAGARARPDDLLDRARVGGRRGSGRGTRAEPALALDAVPHPLDEHGQLANVLRAVREPLPRAEPIGIVPGERGERDPADVGGQQELEGVHGRAHHRPLAEAERVRSNASPIRPGKASGA